MKVACRVREDCTLVVRALHQAYRSWWLPVCRLPWRQRYDHRTGTYADYPVVRNNNAYLVIYDRVAPPPEHRADPGGTLLRSTVPVHSFDSPILGPSAAEPGALPLCREDSALFSEPDASMSPVTPQLST